ncbi:MAG: glycerophosphodiester phosphodiesterase family protein [Anaerolineae bacterium]|jgi:glycerophosphoryl diester phosphodiesterase
MIDLHNLQHDRILVIGHRGAEALAPENTWAGLEAGYRAGADLLEIDVQLTRDGQAVLFHDFTLQPKFGDPRWVRDVTWEELQAFDVGARFDPAFAGQRIPRLDEVLDWARGRIPLQLDLKHGFAERDDGRLETVALDLAEATGTAGQVIVSGWDRIALARVLDRFPQMLVAVNLRERVPDPVGQVLSSGARWVTLFWPQVDRLTVAALHGAGLAVNLSSLFTGDYAMARHLGVDAVSAGDPRAARAALGEVRGAKDG